MPTFRKIVNRRHARIGIANALYMSEFRQRAVKLAPTEGVGISEAGRRLSVPLKTLANWAGSAKTGKRQEVGKEQKPLSELEAGLARIQRELAEMKSERDLLKEFATYFVRESR
jgi:transposase